MTDPRSVTVSIYGRDYTLKGEAEPAYVQKVAALVDQKMREIADQSALASTSKVAILVAVNLADELLRERQKHQQALSLLDERTGQITAFLDKEMEKL
ncbi:MAG: cell division protein ZapA [Candidatus Latescibacteria bacterium]|jgi:cell division protein ZapA|nr:cell division protein ZapA [Candidatus Latescibacterota bacterium]